MSGIEIVYSPPEAVQRLRDLAEAMIQLNGGLTEDLRRILDKKADEFNVHRLDLEDILKELSPVPATIINEKDGTLLVLIPEGEFLAGGAGKDEGGGEPFPVWLPAYYLALYPVTNIQYAQFLSQVQPSESDLKKWVLLDLNCFVQKTDSRYEPYGNKNDHPVVNVGWYGAKAYAEWAGLCLPSELQWEKGARGLNGRKYPWGNTWDESKCRNRENRRNEKTCSVQSYPEGRSPWGLYQMSGNICEWCEDSYESDAYDRYQQGMLSLPSRDDNRVLRGGSWYSLNPERFRGASRSRVAPVSCYDRNGLRLARTVIS